MPYELKLIALYIAIMAMVIGVNVYVYMNPKFPTVEVKYDCRMLMGSWHPDVPQQVIEQCRVKMKKE